MSDMDQIGVMIDALVVNKSQALQIFVGLIITKQLSASNELQHTGPWMAHGQDELY